jgi:hypothetical protein
MQVTNHPRRLYRQQIRAVRGDARELIRDARVPAPPSLVQQLRQLVQQLQQLIAGLFAPAPTPVPVTAGRTQFNVASFNVLGSNHTPAGSGYASGATRMAWAAQLLQQKGIDVVGFQELRDDQANAFKQAAGGTFGLFPGASRDPMAAANSIAWRKDLWDFEQGYTVKVTSHKGNLWPVPVVRLRNKQTGQEAIFTNFHNAPGIHIGTQQHNRDLGTDQEVRLINDLEARTGLPVIVTGDMNEHQHYADRLGREAGMHAANPRGDGIDWILGSAGVAFRGFFRERGALERRVSDHAMIGTRVTL